MVKRIGKEKIKKDLDTARKQEQAKQQGVTPRSGNFPADKQNVSNEIHSKTIFNLRGKNKPNIGLKHKLEYDPNSFDSVTSKLGEGN